MLHIETEDVVGLDFAIRASRISHNSRPTGDLRDIELLSGLAKKGPSHSKSLRMVFVYHTVVAPRYFWQQYSTYRFGVEVSSGSTMHTLLNRKISQSDFAVELTASMLAQLNMLREMKDLKGLKGLLPEGYLQKRYIVASYQALRNIYDQRKHHKLEEWWAYCDWIETLPQAEKLLCGGWDDSKD